MDFDIVKRQIVRACRELDIKELDEIRKYVQFFKWYYDKYFDIFGKEHIHLKTDTVKSVIQNIVIAEDDIATTFDYDDLTDMALQYFSIDFKKKCDFSIVHFSSLEIIRNRYYETLL